MGGCGLYNFLIFDYESKCNLCSQDYKSRRLLVICLIILMKLKIILIIVISKTIVDQQANKMKF